MIKINKLIHHGCSLSLHAIKYGVSVLSTRGQCTIINIYNFLENAERLKKSIIIK